MCTGGAGSAWGQGFEERPVACAGRAYELPRLTVSTALGQLLFCVCATSWGSPLPCGLALPVSEAAGRDLECPEQVIAHSMQPASAERMLEDHEWITAPHCVQDVRIDPSLARAGARVRAAGRVDKAAVRREGAQDDGAVGGARQRLPLLLAQGRHARHHVQVRGCMK